MARLVTPENIQSLRTRPYCSVHLPGGTVHTVRRTLARPHYNGYIYYDGRTTLYQWQAGIYLGGRSYTVYNWSYRKDQPQLNNDWSTNPNHMLDRQPEPPERLFHVTWTDAEYPEDSINKVLDADELAQRVPWLASLVRDPSFYHLGYFKQTTVINTSKVTVKMLDREG